MKIVATRKADQNEAVVDPWTLVHFSTGLALGLMEIPFGSALAGSVAYELAEQLMERRPVGQDIFETKGPETVSNAIMDVLVFSLGHALGGRWNDTDGRRRRGPGRR